MSLPAVLLLLAAAPTAPTADAARSAAALPALGLSLEPPEELVRQRQARLDAGRAEAEARLACRPTAEGLSLCFTVTEQGGRRYLTEADLAGWGLSLEEVEAAVDARARAALDAGRPERAAVTDMDATYCLGMEGDGLDLAGWLHPDRLAQRCGPDLRVAVPARDVLLAWAGGDADLDLVMAVGAARLHEASDAPVSATVYTWDPGEARWVAWGRARPGPATGVDPAGAAAR